VKIAWLTHHLPQQKTVDWQLPGGLIGGAEMTDQSMIEQAPKHYQIQVIDHKSWQSALTFDRVIITGTDMLTAEAMNELSRVRPMVWVHHQQSQSAERQKLFASADPFLTMSSAHSRLEQQWSGVSSQWCHGHIDLDQIPNHGDKHNRALWAARNHPQKGRIAARMWAMRNGIELTEITDAPRQAVLEEMSKHKWFVFLPKGFDSCPRTLIEAEAAGCQIVSNDNAGKRDIGDLHEVIQAQAPRFWSWV
jgi:hypothetical protein